MSGGWRFVLSRRWVLFALIVVVLAYACWWLGGWQFGRLHDRKADNAIISANEHREAVDVGDVVSAGGTVAHADEWRRVTATGRYDPSQTVVVRYQTRDGAAGVDVVVPLVTADGTAVLVDRGWVETDPSGADRGDAPDPPSGEVTITGYLRQDGSGSSTGVDDHSTRAISSRTIGPAIGMSVYAGFVDLSDENPAPATALEPVELPELDNGPHFFYGLQWWFFGLLAIFGFFYLMYDEKVNGRRGTRAGDVAAAGTPGGPTRVAAVASGATPTRPGRPKKVRQSNHPYVRARQEAAARAAAAAGAAPSSPAERDSP